MKQIFKTWGYVITHPKQITFENELGKARATQKTAISWLMVGTLLAALVSGVSSFLYETLFQSYIGSREALAIFLLQLPTGNSAFLDFIGSPTFGGIASFLGFLLLTPIVLLLANVVGLWIARALGGTGSFEKQLFATALFAPVLLMIVNLFGVVRQVGICIVSPIFWLYAIVLSILAIKSIHGLSTAKSAVVVIVPFLVFTTVILVFFPPSL